MFALMACNCKDHLTSAVAIQKSTNNKDEAKEKMNSEKETEPV